ncbi:MAG: inorganic phosphate transporter, partial [SAR324 cluster bacterium]|nr:inorganic phosphate transporter [SAR324 cluster bacterium]
AVIVRFLINRLKMKEAESIHDQFSQIEKIFGIMMIFTACAMAFAHGSNDVANGIGPMAAIVSIVESGGEMAQKSNLPLWILLTGGVGIVLGLSTLGYRVMQTIGSKITELVPTRGFSAELAAAATVVIASRTGIPVSTTQIAVGAVMGVGLARGIGALDLRVVGGIFMSWVITLPVGALLSIFFFFFFRGVFL